MDLDRCAACQFMAQPCSAACVFKSSFPSTEPEKFDRVQRIFGAENVYRLMTNPKLKSGEHVIVATSLIYEAEARIQDSTSGCVGIILEYQKYLDNLKEQINSTKNELTAIVGPERVPKYVNHHMPYHYLIPESSLNAFIDRMEELNEDEKNQVKNLPINDRQKRVTEIVFRRENQEMGADHGDPGASTSAQSSMASGSTGNTQQIAPLPPNQNQP